MALERERAIGESLWNEASYVIQTELDDLIAARVH